MRGITDRMLWQMPCCWLSAKAFLCHGSFKNYRVIVVAILTVFSMYAHAQQLKKSPDNDHFSNAQFLDAVFLNYSQDIGDKEIHYSIPSRNTSQLLPHVSVIADGTTSFGRNNDYFSFDAKEGDYIIIDIDNGYVKGVSGSFFSLLTLYYDKDNDGNINEDTENLKLPGLFNQRNGAHGSLSRAGFVDPMIVYNVPTGQTGRFYLRVSGTNFNTYKGEVENINVRNVPIGATYHLHVSVGAKNLLTDSTDLDNDGLHDDWETAYQNGKEATRNEVRYGLGQGDLQANADLDGDERDNLEEFLAATNPNVNDIAKKAGNTNFEMAQFINANNFSQEYSINIGDLAVNGISNNTSQMIPHVSINSAHDTSRNRSEYYRFKANAGEQLIVDIDQGRTYLLIHNNGRLYPIFSLIRLFMVEGSGMSETYQYIDGSSNYKSDDNLINRNDWYINNGASGSTNNYDGFLMLNIPQSADYIVEVSLSYSRYSRGVEPGEEHKNFQRIPIPSNTSYLLHISKQQISIDDDNLDSDKDGISDVWEKKFGLDPNDASDRDEDFDNDGINNYYEYKLGLLPNDDDSDDDGVKDGDPNEDQDGNGVPNIGEQRWGFYDELKEGQAFFGECADDKKIIHVLNRLSFGPTPKLYYQLKGDTHCSGSSDSLQVDKNIYNWITEQLASEGLPKEEIRRNNTAVQPVIRRLSISDLKAFGLTRLDGLENPVAIINSAVSKGYLDDNFYFYETFNNLSYDRNSKQFIRSSLDNENCIKVRFPTNKSCSDTTDKGQCLRDTHRSWHRSGSVNTVSFRPVSSPQHLRTRMGWFWDNHFSTDLSSNDDRNVAYQQYLQELYEEDTFFIKAFSQFSELALSSATSPTMLHFLNLNDNVYNNQASPANENYARELLELHTMGEGNGYDNHDIQELARILTGWTISNEYPNTSRYIAFNLKRTLGVNRPAILKEENSSFGCLAPVREGVGPYHYNFSTKLSTFKFDNSLHDPGEKTLSLASVFNKSILSVGGSTNIVGEQEGVQAIKFITSLTPTANFICSKLARLIVSDDPSEKTIENCKNTYLVNNDNDEQIAQLIKSLVGYQSSGSGILSPEDEFNNAESYRAKYKDAWEFGFGLGRLLDLELTSHEINSGNRLGSLMNLKMRVKPFTNPSPTGWSEDANKWVNTTNVQDRMALSEVLLFKQAISDRNWMQRYLKTYLFKEHGVDFSLKNKRGEYIADKYISGYLLKMMFGSHYEMHDIILLYRLLNPSGDQSFFKYGSAKFYKLENHKSMFSKVINAVSVLAGHHNYSLQ